MRTTPDSRPRSPTRPAHRHQHSVDGAVGPMFACAARDRDTRRNSGTSGDRQNRLAAHGHGLVASAMRGSVNAPAVISGCSRRMSPSLHVGRGQRLGIEQLPARALVMELVAHQLAVRAIARQIHAFDSTAIRRFTSASAGTSTSCRLLPVASQTSILMSAHELPPCAAQVSSITRSLWIGEMGIADAIATQPMD